MLCRVSPYVQLPVKAESMDVTSNYSESVNERGSLELNWVFSDTCAVALISSCSEGRRVTASPQPPSPAPTQLTDNREQ